MQSSFPFTIDIHKVERSFPPHRHDFLEISLVIEGKGAELVNGVSHDMRPGTLTLVLPFQIHELRSEPGSPLRLYNCMFSAELIPGGHDYLAGFKERLLSEEDDRPTYCQLEPSQSGPIERLLQEMMEEYDRAELWRHALIKMKLTETLIRIDRLRTEFRRESALLMEQGDTPAAIWRVLRFMHIHYRDRLSLSGLAEEFHFNETYLSEQIKRCAGKSFVRLLHEIRIRHACSLLASTDMTVADIAYEVGYGSANTLFTAFRKYKSLTPAAYRKSLENERHRS